MSFLRKAILINTTEFICLLLGVFQSIILSRVLGPRGIGQYAVVSSVEMLTVQIAAFGFPFSFLYYSQSAPEKAKEYLSNTLFCMTIFGLVGGLVLALLIHLRVGYFGLNPLSVKIIIFFSITLSLYRLVFRNVLLIKIHARMLSLMRVLTITSSFIPIVVLTIFDKLNVSFALICFLLSSLPATVLGLIKSKSYIDFSKKPSLEISYKLAHMGSRQLWADLLMVVNGQITLLLIKYFIDDFNSVGYFSRGLRIALLVVMAGQAITPMLLSKWASLSEEVLTENVEKVLRVASTFGMVMIVIILMWGKWLILLLYGKDFLPAVAPMMILLPGTVLLLLSRALMALMGGRGSPEVSAICLFVSVAVNAGLCVYLIPKMEIAGGAWASTAGNIVLLVLLGGAAKIKFKIRLRQCLFVNKNDLVSIFKSLAGRS